MFKHASLYRDRTTGGLRGISFLDVQPKTFHDDDSGKPINCRIVKVSLFTKCLLLIQSIYFHYVFPYHKQVLYQLITQ